MVRFRTATGPHLVAGKERVREPHSSTSWTPCGQQEGVAKTTERNNAIDFNAKPWETLTDTLKCASATVFDLWMSKNPNHCGFRPSLVKFMEKKHQKSCSTMEIEASCNRKQLIGPFTLWAAVNSTTHTHTHCDLNLLAERPAVSISLVIYIPLRSSAAAGWFSIHNWVTS